MDKIKMTQKEFEEEYEIEIEKDKQPEKDSIPEIEIDDFLTAEELAQDKQMEDEFI